MSNDKLEAALGRGRSGPIGIAFRLELPIPLALAGAILDGAGTAAEEAGYELRIGNDGVVSYRSIARPTDAIIRCPECAVGKHQACNGDAWNHELDEPTDCICECRTVPPGNSDIPTR